MLRNVGFRQDAYWQLGFVVLVFFCGVPRLDPREDRVEIWVVESERIYVAADIVR